MFYVMVKLDLVLERTWVVRSSASSRLERLGNLSASIVWHSASNEAV